MSRLSLTDELESVLREHALDAPPAGRTIEDVLARTVLAETALARTALAEDGGAAGTGRASGAPAAAANRRRWPRTRSSVAVLGAAAAAGVLILAGIGIGSLRHGSQSSGAASGAGPAIDGGLSAGRVPPSAAGRLAQGSTPPAAGGRSLANGQATASVALPYPAPALDCSGVPNGVVSTGLIAELADEGAYPARAVEFRCVGANGARSASQVEVFELMPGGWTRFATLIGQDEQRHVASMTTASGGVRIEFSQYGPAAGSQQGEVLAATFPGPAAFALSQPTPTLVATPCTAAAISVSLKTGGLIASDDTPVLRAGILEFRNHSLRACAIEGYPTVTSSADGDLVGPADQTLRGPAGGVTASAAPPVVVLQPGSTVSAMLEPVECGPLALCTGADQISVGLPDGEHLATLAIPPSVAGAGIPLLHPVVPGTTGSD